MNSRGSELRRYRGGCHCGAVQFEITTQQTQVIDCNCSICHKKGFLYLIVPPEQFQLLSDPAMLSTYRFNTGIAQHHFCKICGIHAFYRPRSHPEAYDVNLRALEGEVMHAFEIIPFDGQHWEDSLGTIESAIG